MKEIINLYKTGLLSERAYNEVAKIVGNIIEQCEMDVYKADKRIGELEMVIENLRGDIKIMVEKHAAVKLDGYRELGQRAAEAENKLDSANAHIAVLEAALDEIAGYITIIKRVRLMQEKK